MSADLAYRRCFNHAQREAVARCPSCLNFYCRECITEHEDRIICAACLRKLAANSQRHGRAFSRFLQLGQFIFGLFAAWFFFYLVGEGLLSVPTSFHEGTLWRSLAGDSE